MSSLAEISSLKSNSQKCDVWRFEMEIKKIFVVDDQELKREDLMNYLKRFFPKAEIRGFVCSGEFYEAVASKEVLDDIMEHPKEWLMVVDMQMPHERFRQIDRQAGYKLLHKLQQLGLTCPAVIASSDAIDNAPAREAYESYLGSIQYSYYVDSTPYFREVFRLAGIALDEVDLQLG